jgi:hypothetical protein
MAGFYLIMAVAGAILPYVFFIDYMQTHGMGLGGFMSSLFVNGAAGGFSADLLVSSFVFWAFLWQDHRGAGVSRPWIYVVINLTIGLSCALPLYLYFRTRHAGTSQAGATAV